ncbi:MAG TPA: protein kinase [Polyangiaceae bacterium]|nr:protein kinase [Polyangiaceae bacterium]
MRIQDVVSDDTVLQFGQSLRGSAAPPAEAEAAPATTCPTCGSHFSPDGRFCPFDGTALVARVGWDPSADALIGTTVDGRYEVLSVIGEGGMGTVYEVRHRLLGKRFALKALRKDLAMDGEIAARFIQEARTAAAVSHPGLVEITDFGRLESGQVYFVMELLGGQSLAALLRQGGPLPAARGLSIVRQLVHALKAAHDANIVHRDLKPDNIHVSPGSGDTDFVKIVDFGLAKVIGSSKLTRSGMVFGTPHYMSPEQAAGELVDHRADIYALGIVMYEMFTGKVPFEADSYMGVLTKHMYMTPAPPSQWAPQLKSLGALEDVILRCLQKRPEARYANLAALLADLDQRLPGSSPRAAERPAPVSVLADQLELPTTEEVAPRRRSAFSPALLVGAAFVLGALLVVVLRRSPAQPVPAAASSSAPQPTAAATPTREEPAKPEPQSPTTLAAPPSTSPEHTPARKPAQHAPVSTLPKSKAATGKKRIGGGEIVDPWAH